MFTEEIGNAFESKQAEFEAFRKDRNAKLIIELKTVGNMLLSSNLSGDGVASYNQRQGLVPSQKVNFRDLIPVTQSPTGLYVTYRETGTEGSISAQTEGSGKTQIDYDLTEVKVVSDYISGYARFSKQMMYQLPFLQGTPPIVTGKHQITRQRSLRHHMLWRALRGMFRSLPHPRWGEPDWLVLQSHRRYRRVSPT